MPAKNHLNAEQLEKLQKALKEEENGDIRERILILLLLNDGKTPAKINGNDTLEAYSETLYSRQAIASLSHPSIPQCRG